MDWQHTVCDATQCPYNPSEADNDKSTVHKSAKCYLAKLRGDTALENVSNWMESRIVWVSDEIQYSLPHNLAAHRDEEGEMEHVARSNEPVDEASCPRTPTCKAPSRVDRRVPEQRKHCKVE